MSKICVNQSHIKGLKASYKGIKMACSWDLKLVLKNTLVRPIEIQKDML
jgi:hypothetical protein